MADPKVERQPDGTWRVDGPGRSTWRAHAVTDGDGAVWVDIGDEVIVLPAESGRARRAPAQGHATLEAPMPARVIAVLVAVGDQVVAGASLLLLEAMKMELPLVAPAAGRVAAVHCLVGERVTPGKALVELGPAEDVP